MPEVTLHILDRAMFLDMRGGCTAECLLCQIQNADTPRERLQLLLQIVADAESCSPAIEKEKRPRIVALRMSRDPFRNLAPKIRRYGHVAVALVRLRIANAILSQLPFLQRFIDAKLVAFKVVDAQSESLTRSQATHSENSHHEVLPR